MGSQFEDTVHLTAEDTEARAFRDGHIATTDRKQRGECWYSVGLLVFLLLIPFETSRSMG